MDGTSASFRVKQKLLTNDGAMVTLLLKKFSNVKVLMRIHKPNNENDKES
jgi:hypothetical protein